MVGSAVVRSLEKAGYQNLVVKDRSELDLTNQLETRGFIKNEKMPFSEIEWI